MFILEKCSLMKVTFGTLLSLTFVCGPLWAERELSIEVASGHVTLAWDGEEPLETSVNLEDWEEIRGAVSPHIRDIPVDRDSEFYRLRALPLTLA